MARPIFLRCAPGDAASATAGIYATPVHAWFRGRGEARYLRDLPGPLVIAMSTLTRLILAVDRRVTAAVWTLAALLLAVLACIGLYQVLTRFIWNAPSPWTEELIGRLFVWCVMLGIVAAFRQGALVSVDLMLRLSRGAWLRFVRRLILVVTLGFLGVLVWYGLDLAWRIRFQTFATLPMSIAWAYLALPFGALFSMLAVVANHLDPQNKELELAK